MISVSVSIYRSLCPPLTDHSRGGRRRVYRPRSKRVAAGGIVFPCDAGSNVVKHPRSTASDAAKRGTLNIIYRASSSPCRAAICTRALPPPTDPSEGEIIYSYRRDRGAAIIVNIRTKVNKSGCTYREETEASTSPISVSVQTTSLCLPLWIIQGGATKSL